MAENAAQKVIPPPRITPFYTLSTFVDAEYSAILGYGLYQLAKHLTGFREFLKKCSEKDLTAGGVLDLALTDSSLHVHIASLIIMTIVFLILVDEFARRRVIGYLAPCRSIERFSIEVFIGLFFVIAFMFIPNSSTSVWGALGGAYILTGIWACVARKEAMAWQTQQLKYSEGARVKVVNWGFFYDRLTFYIYYRFAIGLAFMAFMFLMAEIKTPIDYSFPTALSLIALFILIESISYTGEHRLIYKNPSPDGATEVGILTSVCFFPKFYKNWLKRLARPDKRKINNVKNNKNPEKLTTS